MPPSKLHSCESCSESFPNGTSLRRHRYNRHTPPPPFRMDGKVYRVVHNKGRLGCPFDVCSKAYINRDDFQTHLRKAHGADFEVAEDAPDTDADEMFRRGADSMFRLPQASNLSRMLISRNQQFLDSEFPPSTIGVAMKPFVDRMQLACCTWVGTCQGRKVSSECPSTLSTMLTCLVMVKGVGEASTASRVVYGVAQTDQVMPGMS